MFPRTARSTVTAGLATTLLASGLHAATIVVNPLESIQAAIDFAADGDEIVFEPHPSLGYPAIFNQTFDVAGKRLTLRSVDPDDPAIVADTILDGNGLGSVIEILTPGSGPTRIEGLTITGGSGVSGGGVYIDTGVEVRVRNCVFEANLAGNPGGGLYATGTGLVVIEGCTFRENEVLNAGGDGGGFYITGGSVLVTGSHFEGNLVPDSGSALRLDDVSPAQVTGCTFDANISGLNGGAIFIRHGTDLVVDSSRFAGNVAINGGAIRTFDDAGTTLLVRNSAFQGNTASNVGGALFNALQATVRNCTFEGNMPDAINGIGTPVTTVHNAIVWNNGATPILAGAAVAHSIVQFGFAGTQVMDADPLFAPGTLEPMAGSPVIDAGSTSLYNGPMVDLAGSPRGVDAGLGEAATGESVIGPIVDMGAYEFQTDPGSGCPGDLDGDNVVGTSDLLQMLAAWGVCP